MEEKELEKLNRFVNSVDGEVDAQITEMLAQAKRECEQILTTAEDTTLQDAFQTVQTAVKTIQAKFQRQLAQTEQDYRTALLSHREALVEQIFTAIRTRLQRFTQEPDYVSYLCGLLQGEALNADTTILVSAQDLQHADALKQAAGVTCEVKEDATIQLGGLSIMHAGSNLIVDKTLDNAYAEQRKQFSSQYSFNK